MQPTTSGMATLDNANNFANIRMVTRAWNWSQSPSANLGRPGMNTLTLTPCPAGIDPSGGPYLISNKGSMTSQSTKLTMSNNPLHSLWVGRHIQVKGAGVSGTDLDAIVTGFTPKGDVTLSTPASTAVNNVQVYFASYSYTVYIAGAGTAETVPVGGGTCTPGAPIGTINVLTAYSHVPGYTVGSSSSGIQEAWNDAWINDNGAGVSAQTAPYVKLISNTIYNVYATVYLRGRGGVFDGTGSYISCSTRDRCIYIGVTRSSPYVHHHKIYNVSGGTTLTIDGAQVSNASAANGTYTITTASNHPFVVGDTVDCEINSQTFAAHMVVRVASVPNATSFTYQLRNNNVAAGTNTFGWCALLNAFIENNSDHVALQDVNIFRSANPPAMGQFTYGIVNDNDQQFIIERAADRGTGVIMSTANFPMGAFLYERTDQGMAGITYLHNSEFTGDNCVTAGGNGLVISDTVCQGFPVFGVRYFGGYQPGTFTDIYQESTGASPNPMYGYAAQAGYVLSGIANFTGNFPMSGYSPTFQSSAGGTATTVRNYFIVAHSTTGSGPMYFAGRSNPNNSGGANITVKWPSPQLLNANNVTFDVLVTTGSASPPYGTGNFAVATGIPWSTACTTSGMCSFVDTQGALSSYSVQSNFQWQPTFWWWPSNLVLNSANVFVPQIWANHSIVANTGTKSVSVVADRCTAAGNPAQYTPVWVECLAADPVAGSGFIGTVLQQTDLAGNGPPVNSKGRLNLGKAINTPNDLITLQDSNFAKTTSTAGERPSNDAGDLAIGMDQSGGLSQRAVSSISQYINAIPNGTNFQERLTGTGKTFNVPVTVNGNLTVASRGTVTLPVTGTGPQCLHVSSTGVVSGTGSDCGSGGMTTNGATVSGNFGSNRNLQSKRSNSSITTEQSGFYFNNSGATQEVDFALPRCVSIGLWYTFGVDSEQLVRTIATGGAKIRNGSRLGKINGSIAASSSGNQVTLLCIGRSVADSAPEWVVTSIIGSWTVN